MSFPVAVIYLPVDLGVLDRTVQMAKERYPDGRVREAQSISITYKDDGAGPVTYTHPMLVIESEIA